MAGKNGSTKFTAPMAVEQSEGSGQLLSEAKGAGESEQATHRASTTRSSKQPWAPTICRTISSQLAECWTAHCRPSSAGS